MAEIDLTIVDVEFRQGGLTLIYNDGREVVANFNVVNGSLYLDGLNYLEEQSLRHFNNNKISNTAKLDPRLSNSLVSSSIPDFEIIVIPPTALYAESNSPLISRIVDWIINNKINSNIQFVTHAGDISSYDNETIAPYEFAYNALNDLEYITAYSFVAGDRDYESLSSGNTYSSTFDDYLFYFGPDTISHHQWFKGSSPSKQSSYQWFTANGRIYQHISLELEATDDLSWAQNILETNCDKPTIISTHRFIDNNGDILTEPIYKSTPPSDIWSDLIYNNPNVFMVLCSSDSTFPGQGISVNLNAYGYPVWSINSNYELRNNDGDGYIRRIRFKETANTIEVRAFNTNLELYDVAESSIVNIGVNFADRFDADFCNLELPIMTGMSVGKPEVFIPESIYDNLEEQFMVKALPSGQSYIWFSNWVDGTIERAIIDESGISNRMVKISGFLDLKQIELDQVNNKIFFISGNYVYSANTDGTGLTVLTTSTQSPLSIAIDRINNNVYYSTSGTRTDSAASTDAQIRKMNYDGTENQLLISGLSKPTSITIDEFAGILFFCDINESTGLSTIKSFRLLGSILSTVHNSSSVSDAYGVLVDRGVLYFTRQGETNGGLWRSSYSGENILQLIADDRDIKFNPQHIQFDSYGNVYMNSVDGPSPDFRTDGNQVLNGFGYGMYRSEMPQDEAGQFELETYLGNSNEEDEPDFALFDFAIEKINQPSVELTGSINDIAIIDGDKKTIYEINLDAALPVVIGDDTDDFEYRTFLEDDCTSNINSVFIDNDITHYKDNHTRKIFYVEGASDTSPPANTIRSLYFGEENSYNILRSPYDDPQEIVYDVNGGKLYVATNKSIFRCDVDGTNVEVMLPEGYGHSSISSMDWDDVNDILFWTCVRSGVQTMFSGHVNVSGSFVVTKIKIDVVFDDESSTYSTESVAVDPIDNHIYWTHADNSHVYRMNYDGSGTVKIDLGLHNPKYLRVDPLRRKLYWSENDKIVRSDLDGENIEDVVIKTGLFKRFDVNQINTYS